MGESATFWEKQHVLSARRRAFLTPEQERDFASHARTGCRECRERLIESHVPLVDRMARRYRLDPLAHEDAVQDGVLGLIKAVDRFDSDHGARLSTYAAWWIRQGILAGIRRRDCIWIPNGRPSRRVIEIVRLDGEIADSHSSNGDDAGLEQALRGLIVQATGEALAGQPARDRSVLTLRFGLFGGHERTLSEVAAIVGLTRERVRQIEKRALRRLRDGPNSHALAALIDEPR